MKYEKFEKLIKDLQQIDESVSKAHEINIDLYDFLDPFHQIVADLMKEIYGEEGYDWFSWFCYENDYGYKGLEASDNGTPICYSIKSLYEYLEKNYKRCR